MSTLWSIEDGVGSVEDRRGQRDPMHFPIEREIRFRTMSKRDEIEGAGMTLEISSKRLVFRTDQLLPIGKHIEMAISWPARLDQRCALKLMTSGRIVRSGLGLVAVSIEHFEFRTLGANGLAV